MGPVSWGVGKGGGRTCDERSGIPINTITWDLAKAIDGRLSFEPVWKECTNDSVAHFEFGHITAPIDHFASPISHRNSGLRRPPESTDDGEIMVVEGVCVEFDGDVMRSRWHDGPGP